MKNLALHWKIIIGLVLGVVFALVSSSLGWSEFTINWIDPFGTIFINLLKLIAVPLVLFSIIKGIAGLHDTSKLGRLGAKTLGFLCGNDRFGGFSRPLVGCNRDWSRKERSMLQQRTDNRFSLTSCGRRRTAMTFKDGICQSCDEANAEKRGHAVQDKLKNAAACWMSSCKSKMQSAQPDQGWQGHCYQLVVDMVPSNIFLSLNDNGLMLAGHFLRHFLRRNAHF
jgi:hypothetical protein